MSLKSLILLNVSIPNYSDIYLLSNRHNCLLVPAEPFVPKFATERLVDGRTNSWVSKLVIAITNLWI